jgi:hypothetical protein
LHAGPERSEQPLPVAASRIAARHSDRPVAVEVVRWRDAPAVATANTAPAIEPPPAAAAETAEPESHRPRLLAVLAFPDTDEVEVHLILDGRRTIGRAPGSRGLVGVAEATMEALSGFGADFDPKPRWARPLDPNGDESLVLIAVAVDDDNVSRYGLASGASSIDATARATLDAVNRRLSYLLQREF